MTAIGFVGVSNSFVAHPVATSKKQVSITPQRPAAFTHISTTKRVHSVLRASAASETDVDPKPELKAPTRPRPPQPMTPSNESKLKAAFKSDDDEGFEPGDSDAESDDEQGGPRGLVRPKDPSELRTESERRRISPVHSVRRRRKKRIQALDEEEWDNMETIPLVKKMASPESGEDYWIEARPAPAKPQVPKKKKKVDVNVKEKLRKETTSPYKDNWIGIVVLAMLVLVVLYNIFPHELPIIRVPDL